MTRATKMTTALKTVLIVDDEPGICLLIEEELSTHEVDCNTTCDPSEARKLLVGEQYDVLIVDISMPRISGLDLLALARRVGSGCKVILMTGHVRSEHLVQALMLGAYDYIEKPFDMVELVETVLRAISDEAILPQLPLRAAAAMQLSTQTKRAALDSVWALARAVEAKDPYTRRHSEHVAHYAANLASAMGVPLKDREMIHNSALLHDIGKIGVPDHILTKPGKLGDDEFEHIRRHPALGADILSNISMFKQMGMIVRHHHERWDGSGYPDGLAAEEILWEARLINVADSIDAMLMERIYKPAYDIEQMMMQLRTCSGKQFDPDIAAAAMSWCEKNMDQLILPNRPIESLVA
jgi:putative two-component system response regulator